MCDLNTTKSPHSEGQFEVTPTYDYREQGMHEPHASPMGFITLQFHSRWPTVVVKIKDMSFLEDNKAAIIIIIINYYHH